jgi:3,4-dihydroxy 2-butanone 4-phosphate synthase
MKSFAELIKNDDSETSMDQFGRQFRSPGHVPICVASSQLLQNRCGHTELVIAMMIMAGLVPVGSGCEMMGDKGMALSKNHAMKYAEDHGLIFLEGKEIKKAWKQWLK